MSEERDIHVDREKLDEFRTNRYFKGKIDISHEELTLTRAAPSNLNPTNISIPSNQVHDPNQKHMSPDERDHLDFFNGTFAERITAAVSEAGGIVTLTIGQSGGGTLKGRFASGYGTLPDNSTIALTVGTDTSPQINYIYVLQSDPTTLVKDTSDWPWTVDHIKITRIFCPSAAFVQSKGVYSFHLWNDENDDTILQGHMSHMTDRERLAGAIWDTGVAGAGTDGYLTPTATNVELKANAGVVYQMHRHDIPAFDTSGTDVVLVKNWNGTAYHDITNLYDIVADSGGNAIGATKWFKITIWGVANLGTSSFHPIILNLPSGFYNTQAACELDADGHGDVVIPTEFRGTGYLIASIVIQRAATWVIGSTKVLLGQTPTTIGGGGARYTDAEVEAYVNSVANAGIATPDSLVFVDATDGALKQDLVSDLVTITDAAAQALDPFAHAGDVTIADSKEIQIGNLAGGDLRLYHDTFFGYIHNITARLVFINAGDDITEFRIKNRFVIRDSDDSLVTIFDFNTSNRSLDIGVAADPITTTNHGDLNVNAGSITMDGSGTDDEALQVPVLTAAPATLANGMIWMEADGLHIYYNGAEKVVAGV